MDEKTGKFDMSTGARRERQVAAKAADLKHQEQCIIACLVLEGWRVNMATSGNWVATKDAE